MKPTSHTMSEDAQAVLPLAVVVPVYKNEATLRELARRLQAALAGVVDDYRLVFVVDASPDGSWPTVQELMAQDKRVAGILLPENVGQHRAILHGLAALCAERYAVMDADLQDPPERLGRMIREAKAHGGSVFAGRIGAYQAPGRMLTSRLFKRLLGLLSGLPANAGTYFLVSDRVARAMLGANIRRPQVVVMARYFSPVWSVVPYRRDSRAQGDSAYTGWMRLKAAYRAIACVLELKRNHNLT